MDGQRNKLSLHNYISSQPKKTKSSKAHRRNATKHSFKYNIKYGAITLRHRELRPTPQRGWTCMLFHTLALSLWLKDSHQCHQRVFRILTHRGMASEGQQSPKGSNNSRILLSAKVISLIWKHITLVFFPLCLYYIIEIPCNVIHDVISLHIRTLVSITIEDPRVLVRAKSYKSQR